MNISVLGIDLGKNVCSVVGLYASGAVVMRRRMRRDTLIGLAEKLPACVVGMETCCGSHHVGRVFASHGQDVRLMSPERRPTKRQGAEERQSRRRGDRGGDEATNDVLCRTEEPGPTRYADASSIARPSGR